MSSWAVKRPRGWGCLGFRVLGAASGVGFGVHRADWGFQMLIGFHGYVYVTYVYYTYAICMYMRMWHVYEHVCVHIYIYMCVYIYICIPIYTYRSRRVSVLKTRILPPGVLCKGPVQGMWRSPEPDIRSSRGSFIGYLYKPAAGFLLRELFEVTTIRKPY